MGSRQPRASPFLELISDLVADVGRSGCIGVEDAIIPLFPDFPPGGDDDTVGLLRLGRRLEASMWLSSLRENSSLPCSDKFAVCIKLWTQ